MNSRLNIFAVNHVILVLSFCGLISAAMAKSAMLIVVSDSRIQKLASQVGELFLVVIENTPVVKYLALHSVAVGTFVLIYLTLVTLYLLLFFSVQKAGPDYQHFSGIQILKSGQAKKHANKFNSGSQRVVPLYLHPLVPLNDKVITGNIFAFGMQGSGKSTIIKYLLLQLSTTFHRQFIFDLKHEYEAFTDAENRLILRVGVYNSATWNISADVLDESDATNVSVALIEEDADSTNRFFTDAAREITKGVLIALLVRDETWGWREFADRLFARREQLYNILLGAYPPAAALIEDDSKTTQSIRAVISTRLSWLFRMSEYSAKSQQAFSIKSWLSDEKKQTSQIIFQPSMKETGMSRAICNAITTLIASNLLAKPDQEKVQTWLILDELGNLPKSTALEQWLTLSRSKGGRTIAGTQSLSQLTQVYGEKSASTLLSLFKTVIVLGLGAAGKSAQQASEALGNHRVLTVQRSKSNDGSINLSEQFTDRAVVSPEEITNITEPDQYGVSGFVAIGGREAVYQLKWPYPSAKKIDN